jgi:cell wall-associated NlpC family hydrolase
MRAHRQTDMTMGNRSKAERAGWRGLGGACLLITLGLSAGCSSIPRAPDRADDRGVVIARTAAHLIGSPYQFGGADTQGFDCSGLVVYVHQRAGLDVPRTADEQRRAAHPISRDALLPGDVVFFRTHSRRSSHHVDHVGIYTGEGRFIHAPHSGEAVSYASLETGYYRKHFVSAGRFWEADLQTARKGVARSAAR